MGDVALLVILVPDIAAQEQVPIIAVNGRRAANKAEEKRLSQLPFSRLDVDTALYEPDRRRRLKARSAAERINARLKDDPCLRFVRMRGHPKVHALLMSSLLVIFASALLGL
jgi:hypothetical protein